MSHFLTDAVDALPIYKTPEKTIEFMKQSKRHSFIESTVQTVIGLGTSIILQMVLYPILGIPVSLSQNLIITAVFFVVSIIRGYLIRRLFNK